jgi:hypothetical protein
MNAAELFLIALIVVSVLGVVLQSLLIFAERRRKQHPQELLVVATVVWIEEKSKRKASRWYVTAEWVDAETQRAYIFRSPPFTFRPKVRIGDTLTVSFNPRHATRYQMHL